MSSLGINGTLLLIQVVLIILFFGLPLLSLFDLSTKKLTGIPLVLWALVICGVPVMGSLAYWIIKPIPEDIA